MFMKNYIIFLLLLTFYSCQEKKSDCNDCDEEITSEKKAVSNEDLEMYIPTELASLMLEMYDANEDWKEEILKGNIPKEFPEKYKTIHTAESSNENAGSDYYNAMATSYISSIEGITNATPENVIDKFNAMVNVCVECHIQVCPGPVTKIKKLIIKE